jgi:NADH-quinone oxidoreductase subunit J
MIELIFYAFASLLVVGALSVVFSSNPVKSVLSLVFCFLNAAALLLLTGAEFVSIILIVVYVGAVVVLFLFIVMTLSTEEFNYKKLFKVHYLPILVGMITSVVLAIGSLNIEFFMKAPDNTDLIDNTQAIASKLYTDSFLQFQLGGIVLLVALIGAIVLSNRRDTTDIKKQNVWKQLTTTPKDRIELVNKGSGDGV